MLYVDRSHEDDSNGDLIEMYPHMLLLRSIKQVVFANWDPSPSTEQWGDAYTARPHLEVPQIYNGTSAFFPPPSTSDPRLFSSLHSIALTRINIGRRSFPSIVPNTLANIRLCKVDIQDRRILQNVLAEHSVSLEEFRLCHCRGAFDVPPIVALLSSAPRLKYLRFYDNPGAAGYEPTAFLLPGLAELSISWFGHSPIHVREYVQQREQADGLRIKLREVKPTYSTEREVEWTEAEDAAWSSGVALVVVEKGEDAESSEDE